MILGCSFRQISHVLIAHSTATLRAPPSNQPRWPRHLVGLTERGLVGDLAFRKIFSRLRNIDPPVVHCVRARRTRLGFSILQAVLVSACGARSQHPISEIDAITHPVRLLAVDADEMLNIINCEEGLGRELAIGRALQVPLSWEMT